MEQQSIPSYIIDGIRAIGIHNGVLRVEFIRLDVDGIARPVVELAIPMTQVKPVSAALARAGATA
jgi:hypothetical protein